MNLRFITRLPWFEVFILLILVAIGWAAWEFNRISMRQSKEQSIDEKAHPASKTAFQDRMEKEFRLTWERHVLNNSNAMQSLRDAKDPHKLPGAYRMVADRLQNELPKMQPLLEKYSSRTNWRDQVTWQKKSQELKDWLWSQQLQLESEGLVAQSQELAAKGTNTLAMDLGTLYRDAERRLTNYMAKGTYISTLARTLGPIPQTNVPAIPPPIASPRRTAAIPQTTQTNSVNLRDELAESQVQVQGLLELASQARLEAAKLDRQPMILPEPLEKIERDLSQVGDDTLQFALLSEVARLQPVYYALLAAGFGLALFLTIAIYRRVVERLNFRLYESTTENKLAHLGHLSAWLAHEIKQPLTAINAWLWTLQKRVKQEMPEHMGTTAIRKEINRLDQIVKDFLRFTQPAAPKFVLLNAESVLREILELVGPGLEQKGIRLSLDGRMDVNFRADPQQLKQVLINLVTNAAESIENGGAITLRVRTENARLNGRLADALLIEVEDSGSGIPEEVRGRLFDPFFSTKEDGTGLGLPIARKIVEAHKGTLEFKTALGEGTTFRIALPMVREERISA